MGKKDGRKGYIKGLEHFRAVASGKVQGSGSGYAAKAVARIKGERPALAESKTPLQDRFEQEAERMPTRAVSRENSPIERLKETGAMMTDAYFFGASRPVVTARHFIDAALKPPFFPAVGDEAFKNKPCRLIAICHNDGEYLHTWTLRRAVGNTGKNYEDIQLRSTHVNMYAFLKSWEKEQALSNRTEAVVPHDLSASLVSLLSSSGVSQVSTDIQTQKLQSRGLEFKSIF